MEIFPEFRPWKKIYRLSRAYIITEKIDGTNGLICITEDNKMHVGSRTRWITPEQDNYGFAKWTRENEQELLKLGPGYHYGEWWGKGIQRNYGKEERTFSLFNTARWNDMNKPICCSVVPVLREINFLDTDYIETALATLGLFGSIAAPGFMNPEGIVIYHKQSGYMFKKTIENDDKPKGEK